MAQRTRRRPREETRRDVLDAAARVFARQGLNGTSVEAVSEEAGYSRGAVYSNFKSKEDLFLALWEERIARRRRELREVIENAGAPAAGLAPASMNVMQALDREREWFLLYFEFALHAARDPEFADRFERVRTRRRGPGEGRAPALARSGRHCRSPEGTQLRPGARAARQRGFRLQPALRPSVGAALSRDPGRAGSGGMSASALQRWAKRGLRPAA
jgi:AcrR family transcriptional regulator